MRQRLLEGDVLPNKIHLWRLPDLPEPAFTYLGASKQAIVLLPIFYARRDPTAIEDWAVRSALWARRSWLKFSDALHYDVAVKFYVEVESAWQILPIFDRSGVERDDIIFFHGNHFESDLKSNTGNKKTAVHTDTRLSGYDWVVVSDIDLFVASPDRTILPFFEKLFSAAPAFGAAKTSKPGDNKDNLIKSNWLDAIDNKESRDDKITEWVNRAMKVLSTLQMSPYMCEGIDYKTCHNGLTVFPAKEYHRDYPEALEWLVEATILLAADQCTWSMFDIKGHKVFDICDTFDIDFVLDWRVDLEKVGGRPYLFHFNNYETEHLWRDDLDIR